MPEVVQWSAPVGLEITLAGMFGFDLATVASREMLRAKLIASSTEQIDHFLTTVTVKEQS